MAFFSEWANFKVEKTTVVHYYDKKYTTAKGFAMALGDQVASQTLDRFAHKNPKKYGEGTYRNLKALELWKENRKRIRAKFIRRATPILEKLWN
jgi:hypothetical protein